ncbi:retrovirus-related pol polyprotein from transposon TNT 1-94 [Tanacetum coccineum]|uniref:Retrovirus-related pol polyprotein from transposon TNT 1-94 n=1 Tax=Tanacetum coccineum TaxID=301880 RepID=A0ABQ5DET9_9ASTR
MSGCRYFLSIVDDYSRRVWVHFLRHKNEAFSKFKEWKQLVENQTGRKQKKLRTDNGLEFCNQKFNNLCKESGIARHLTVAGTPQQNGLAERMNRTLLNKVRCLLIHSGLSNSFWAEATAMAAYLINRSPSTELEKKTPMDLWSGHPANYEMLRIFGCVAYSHVNQGKLKRRAIKCIFLGDTLKGAGAADSGKEVEFEVELQGSRVEPTVDPHTGENPGNEDEEQDEGPQQQNLDNYVLVRDRAKRTTTIPARYRDEGNVSLSRPSGSKVDDMAAYPFAISEEEDTHEPITFQEAINSSEKDEWVRAMKEEMSSLKKNHTWELVDQPPGQKLISYKWLYKIKEGIEGVQKPRYKARVVARGFTQRAWIDYNEVKNRSRIGINKWYQSFALRNFDLEDMELESTNSGPTAKLPILKLGEYKMWAIRIKQYFQIQDYALWEVIENGDSWVSISQTTEENGITISKMSTPATAEEKIKKKNDVKAGDNTVYAFMVENPNGSNVLHQDLEQIHEDDLEAIDLKWQLSLLSVRAKNWDNFECRAPRSKESQFRNQDNTRKQGNNEDKSSKAMLAIDGVGFDWSDMAEEQVQTNMALMAFSDSEVYTDKTCSKTCLKNYETLKKQCDDLLVKLNESEFKAITYKRGLATLEDQIITYKKNEVLFSEEIGVLKREVACKDYEINMLKSEFEKVKQEKDGIEFKIEKFDKASKDLDQLLGSQITDKCKKGLGYSAVPSPNPLIYNRPNKLDMSYSGLDEFEEPEFKGYGPKDKEQVSQDTGSFVESSPKIDKETVFPVNKKVEFTKPKYHEKPFKRSVSRVDAKTTHPSVHRNMSPEAVLLKTGLTPLNIVRLVNAAHPKTAVHSANSKTHFFKQAQSTAKRPFYRQTTLTRRSVHTAKGHYYNGRPRAVTTARLYSGQVNVVRVKGVNDGMPQQDDKGFVDSGCSRHMTKNIAYL